MVKLIFPLHNLITMAKIIIEHLDPRLWKWSLLEYSHVSDVIGKENLIITNITGEKSIEKLSRYGKVHKEKVKDLHLKNVCILDPGAKETLSPADKFDYLVVGGILGDYPPQKRTKKELTSKLPFPARNLGKSQMSTNTAAIVAWKIMQGTPLEDMKFKNKLVIPTGRYEEVILPYKYLVEEGKLVLPEGYIEMAKKMQ
jgi:ribosome biogenesis SPOUT family RNA methylase Rps3